MKIFKDKEPKLKHGIIAIDPGVDGAFCLMTNTKIITVSMPDRNKPELIAYELQKLKNKAMQEFDGIKPKVIIEHVSGRGMDSGYTIAILCHNYGLCVMACICLGITPVAFYPISWKTYMNLKVTKPKGFKNIKITPAMKKNKTVKFIRGLFPWLDFNQKQCDAIAIAIFGYRLTTGIIKLKKGQTMQGEALGLKM